MLLLIVFLVIDKSLTVIFPMLLGFLIDNVLTHRDMVKLGLVFLAMVGTNVLQSGFGALYGNVAALTEQRIDFDIRWTFFSHILHMSLRFFDRRRVGELIYRLEDVSVIQNLVSGFIQGYGSDVIGVIIYGIYLATMSWKLMLVGFATLPLFAASSNLFLSWFRRKEQARWDLDAQSRALINEALVGIRVIKAFAIENFIVRKIKHLVLRQRKLRMEMQLAGAGKGALTSFAGGLGTYVTLCYGGYLVIRGSLTVGELMAFFAVMGSAFGPAQRLITIRQRLQGVVMAAERFSQIFDEQSELRGSARALRTSRIEGRITFRDVGFGYTPQVPVLKQISLEVRPGTTVAFVGRSGAGKTTLVNLVPRFYDPDQGQILIDGQDVKQFELRSLRRQIGMVLQDPFLFNGSVWDNVVVARRNPSREEVEHACVLANAHEFIIRLPDGYQALIGERGVRLSGGQKQRLSIARALLHDPRILILDEATSSVDLESEALIQAGLKELLKNRTTLVVAHRLSTIINADLIVVMDEGRIVETGNHFDLLQRSGLYARLYSNLARL
ncbi:MAG TPA: peptidase domain-containing ABC transporter [Verrucomicrobiae bacterium]|nr:peptidase domain-containing ABC transporter [Verrucomicrobiae bacterium]